MLNYDKTLQPAKNGPARLNEDKVRTLTSARRRRPTELEESIT